MFDRIHIERVLKINGVDVTASDEEVRAVLLGARYSEQEVETAIAVLRSSTESGVKGTESLNKLIRTDSSLNAKEISKLLGIDIALPHASSRSTKTSERSMSIGHHVVIWSLAIIITILGIGLSMYALEFGFFHPASALTFYEHR
jgi:hypothetical protein